MMDSKQINVLAMALEDSILTQELTQAEVFMLMGLLQARVERRLNSPHKIAEPAPGMTVTTQNDTVTVAPQSEVKPLVPKSIHYDPYDPAPGMPVEKVPPREEQHGKVLASKNMACTCSKCGKVGYLVNGEIVDGMKVKDFIASFIPLEGVKPLNTTVEIQNLDGNISIDCPMCNGMKSLYLIGKKG